MAGNKGRAPTPPKDIVSPAADKAEPSLRSDFMVAISGWDTDDEEDARRFGQMLLELTRSYSQFLELGLLEKIVVAYDYRAALAALESGGQRTAAEPTSNEFGEGGAMAVTVRRGDAVASVVVIWTPLVRQLFAAQETEEKALAGHTFAHELIHVDDLAFMHRTFPGGALATWERDPCHGALLSIASPAYSEYSASRRSAFAKPDLGLAYFDMLAACLADAVRDVAIERRKYRMHGNLDAFWNWAHERARFIFQALGYAIGHAEWVIAAEVDPAVKEQHRASLDKIAASELGWLVDACRMALLPIFEQSEWRSLDVYDPLNVVAEKLLNTFGLYPSLREGGLYIDIPFRGLFD